MIVVEYTTLGRSAMTQVNLDTRAADILDSMRTNDGGNGFDRPAVAAMRVKLIIRGWGNRENVRPCMGEQ